MSKGGFLYKLPIILNDEDKMKIFEDRKKELNELGLWDTKDDTGDGDFTSKTFSIITIFNRSIMCTIKSVIETEIKKINLTTIIQYYLDKLHNLNLIPNLDATNIDNTDFDINCLTITTAFLNDFFDKAPSKAKDVCLLQLLFNYNILEQVCNTYGVTEVEAEREEVKNQLVENVIHYFKLNIRKYNQDFDYSAWVNYYIPKSLKAIDDNGGLTYKTTGKKKTSAYDIEETKKITKDCGDLESIITNYKQNQEKKNKLKEELGNIIAIGHDNERIKAYRPSPNIKTSVDADIKLLSLKSSKKYFELFNYLVPLNLEGYSGLSNLLNELFGTTIKHLYYNINNKYYEININTNNVEQVGNEDDALHFLLTNELKIQKIERPDGRISNIIPPIVIEDDIYPNYNVNEIQNSWATYALILNKKTPDIYNNYLTYIQKYDENLSNGFFSFIGDMGPDFRYHSLNSLFYPFLYSGKISVLIELLKDDYSQHINIGDDLHIENLTKLMNTAMKSFGTNTYDRTVKSIEDIYKNNNINFTEIKKQIISTLIEKDDTMIISYMNFNLQKDIIAGFNADLREDNYEEFFSLIEKLNNIIKYDINKIRDYFAFRLTYIVISFVLLAKEINVKLLLSTAYLLIINYIKANYRTISKIVNIKQLNDDLFTNNIFVGGVSRTTIQRSLFRVISDNYPSLNIRVAQYSEFQFANDGGYIRRQGSNPCVEIAFLNLLKYMVNIEGTEKLDWTLLPPNTSQNLKNFLSYYDTETKIQTLTRSGANNNLIQNYYRAIHNILSEEEFRLLTNKIAVFERNLARPISSDGDYYYSYWRTYNIHKQIELPGRYSFFCIVISKLFGLEHPYNTLNLINDFNMFKDVHYNTNIQRVNDMNVYPNNTFKYFLQQFRSYGEKLDGIETYVYHQGPDRELDGLFVTEITMNLANKIKFNLRDVHAVTTYTKSAKLNYRNIYTNLYSKYNEFIFEYKDFESDLDIKIPNNNLLTFNPNDYFFKYFIYKNKPKLIFSVEERYQVNPLTNPKLFKLINKHNIMYLHKNTLVDYNYFFINDYLSTYFNFYNYSFPEYTTYMLCKYFDKLKEKEFIIPLYFYNIIYYKYFNTNNIQKILTLDYFYKLLELPPEVLSYSYYISDKTNTSDKLLINFKNIVFILFTRFVFSTDERSTSKFSDITVHYITTYYFEFMFFVFLKSDEMRDQAKDIRYALLQRLYEVDYLLLIKYMMTSLPISLVNYKILYTFIKNKLDGEDDRLETGDTYKARMLFFALLMFVPQKFRLTGLGWLLDDIAMLYILNFYKLLHTHFYEKFSNQLIFNEDLFTEKINAAGIKKVIEEQIKSLKICFNFKNVPSYPQDVFAIDYKTESSESEDYGKLQKDLLLYKAIRKNIISFNEKYKAAFKEMVPGVTNNTLPIDKFYPYSKDIYSAIKATNIINSMYNDSVDDDAFQSIFKIPTRPKIRNEISPDRKFNVKDVNSTVKWYLMNTLTSEINKVLFKDVNKDNIFNFHMMTTTLINYELDQNDDIKKFRDIFRLVYKGGSSMLFLKQMFNEQISEQNRPFFNKFNNDFSRSDIDFNIVIDKKKHIPREERAITEVEFKELYININKAVSTALIKVKYFLSTNNEIYYNFNSVTKKDLQNCICELKNTLNTHKTDSVYQNITELVGISFWNKIYTAEALPNIMSPCIINSDRIIINSPRNIKEVLKFEVTKGDYYVGKTDVSGKANLYSRYIEGNHSFDRDSTIKNNIINSVYYYANETHLYKTASDIASFALHRIKLNSKIIFKANEPDTLVPNTGYGEFNCPIEIVDVSIKKYNDDFDIDIDHEIDEYTYKHPIYGDYKFYSYSVYGFLNDLIINMFIHNEYPWNDNKYNKRMSRLIYFVLINLITKMPDNYPLVITKIIAFLNKLKTDIQNKKASSTEVNVDGELKDLKDNLNTDTMLIHTLCDLFGSLALMGEVYGDDTFPKYVDLLNTTLTLFSEFNESITANRIVLRNTKESNFFNKYLKYKSKYLQLKSESKKY